jgi:cell division septum initiation protein DivIVA
VPLAGSAQPRGGEVAAVLNLIDRLEALVAEGRHIPVLGRIMIDEREFMEIIDQLRVSLPEELRQARRITQERERLLAEAQSDAERVTSLAQEQASRLLQETEVSRSAERRAELILNEAERQGNETIEAARQEAQQILFEAQQQAESVRAGADGYAREVLTSLDQELGKHQGMVRKGLAVLERSIRDVSTR